MSFCRLQSARRLPACCARSLVARLPRAARRALAPAVGRLIGALRSSVVTRWAPPCLRSKCIRAAPAQLQRGSCPEQPASLRRNRTTTEAEYERSRKAVANLRRFVVSQRPRLKSDLRALKSARSERSYVAPKYWSDGFGFSPAGRPSAPRGRFVLRLAIGGYRPAMGSGGAMAPRALAGDFAFSAGGCAGRPLHPALAPPLPRQAVPRALFRLIDALALRALASTARMSIIATARSGTITRDSRVECWRGRYKCEKVAKRTLGMARAATRGAWQ